MRLERKQAHRRGERPAAAADRGGWEEPGIKSPALQSGWRWARAAALMYLSCGVGPAAGGRTSWPQGGDSPLLPVALPPPRGRQLANIPKRRGIVRQSATRYMLVLARHDETIDWVRNIPEAWRVVVYNTGADDLPRWPERQLTVVPTKNTKHGKEGLIYAKHLADSWGPNLADYTVFSQGNPFDHNDHFLDLLWHPTLLAPVQTMSSKFSESVPPRSVRDLHSPDGWYRSDRFSLRTMESVYFTDCCIHTASQLYRDHFNLSIGTNIISHVFGLVGLPRWVPEEQEIASFAYAGMFGASKQSIMQHPQSVYASLVPRLQEHVMVGYLWERCWLMLLGGPDFVDHQPGSER